MKKFLCIFILLSSVLVATEPRCQQRFVLVTPMKAGTHLLYAAMDRLTDSRKLHYVDGKAYRHITDKVLIRFLDLHWKNGRYCHMHHMTKQRRNLLFENGYKIVSIVRDPRDSLVSQLFWEQRLYPTKAFGKGKKADIRRIIADYIEKGTIPWEEQPAFYPECLLEPECEKQVCIVRFEDLVGSGGGGSDQEQWVAVNRLHNFIEAKKTKKEIGYIAARIYGVKSATMRKGQIGGWKMYFTQDMTDAYNAKFKDYLEKFGYEI